MDLLDELCRQYAPNRDDILKAVDEYTLYCYYTDIRDLPVKRRVRSPIREHGDKADDNPSFAIFPTAEAKPFEFLWKDHGKAIGGNIFDLVRILYRLSSYNEVYALICQDFSLDFKTEQVVAKVIQYQRPILESIKLRIHQVPFSKRGLNYWSDLNIGVERLEKFNVKQFDYYYSVADQETPTGVLDPSFAYTIGNHYQLYSPYAGKDRKWRSDLPEGYFLGYLQLPKTGEKLVIDKSFKDIIFDDVLGYPATAGKSETTMIPHHKMLELHKRFPKIYLTLDPDKAGFAQTDKYMALYPWLIPRFLTEAKDKTDLCKLVGFERAKEIIIKLLQ